MLGYANLPSGADDPTNPDSLAQKPLGHLECIIRADTNCVTHEVSLEAWSHYVFTDISVPIVAVWSSGQTAHKISVVPPGTWSWDASTIGCEPVHQFNTITFDHGFYNGVLELEGQGTDCPFNHVAITVNSQGYNNFSAFQWMPVFQQPRLAALTFRSSQFPQQ